MNEKLDLREYYLDINKISEYSNCLSVTRMLAKRLMENPYMTVKSFLDDLSDIDMAMLVDLIDSKDGQVDDFLIMAEMLATAEGCSRSETEDEFIQRMQTFINFCVVDSLGRKGFVKVYRENMSFDEDSGSNIIVEKLDIDYDALLKGYKDGQQ